MKHWILCCLAAAISFAGCSGDTTSGEATGSLSLSLELGPGIVINQVDWTISGNDMEPMSGTINTSAPGATASVEVFGLPPGENYLVELEATSEDGDTTCGGSAEFDVAVGEVTDVMVLLNCKRPERLGGVRVNGEFNICAELTKVVVSPLQTSVGNEIDLSAAGTDVEGDPIAFLWSATGGVLADANAASTTFTCGEVGQQVITITISDDAFEYCMDDWAVSVTCVAGEVDLCEGVDCNDNNECTEDSCNPANGQCSNAPVADDTACEGGTCQTGVCEPTDLCEGVDCNDNNECTTDACDPGDGSCSNTPVTDDTACEGGTCQAGACVPSDLCQGVNCSDNNECTSDLCNPANGQCSNPAVADDTACEGGTCQAGVCEPADLCEGVNCNDNNECTADSCDAADGQCDNTPVANGTACEGGTCQAGICEQEGPPDPDPQTKTITVGCRNNVTADVSMLPYDLTVDPGPIAGGQSVSVSYDGVAQFAESFLDAAQGAVPGGVTKANLVDISATTQVRSGGTFPNVELVNEPIPYECVLFDTGPGAQTPCSPANDVAVVPGSRGNTGCQPQGSFNACGRIVYVPISNVEATCDGLGTAKAAQFDTNGFCVTGGLPLALEAQASTGTAAVSGQILFGWYDSATVCPPNIPNQGTTTCTLPAAVFTAATGPLGLRVNASGLSVALECNQAADGDPSDAENPVSQPNSALIPFDIQ
jgi:hypothetical protein